MVKITSGGETYYMNKRLKEQWDKIKDGKLKKLDEDRVYIVDGRERSGKSLFALQQAAYIDPSILIDLSRITFDVEKTLEAIRNTTSTASETKVIIFDEAFRGLSSKSAISKTNKRLVQALMEMGQSNLVLFLVSPSFFLLELYAAVVRSQGLFHIVKELGGKRRHFKGFSYKKKAQLYQRGMKKGWGYALGTRFKDYFFGKWPGGKGFEAKYRAKKAQSLRDMDEVEKKNKPERFSPAQRKKIAEDLKKEGYKDSTKIASIICGVTARTIRSDLTKISPFSS